MTEAQEWMYYTRRNREATEAYWNRRCILDQYQTRKGLTIA